MIHPLWLVTLTFIILLALVRAYRRTRNGYVLAAVWMEVIFGGVYLFVEITNPHVLVIQAVARPAFVLMQAIGAGMSIFYLTRNA